MKPFLAISATLLCIIPLRAGDSFFKEIKGTGLAELTDAFEVMRRISILSESGSKIFVAGQGEAVIYVDGRRLNTHEDLYMIPARNIESIEIFTEPRVEYGNKGSLILITIIEPESDEFKLEDAVEVSASPFFGAANNLELSGRKGKFLYEGGLAVNYVPTRDIEKRFEDLYAAPSGSATQLLDTRTVRDFYDDNRDLSVDVKGELGYIVAPGHQLSLRYEYDFLRTDGVWEDLRFNVFQRRGGKIDLEHPSESYNGESTSKADMHKHSVSLSYDGEVNDWTISANIDLYGGARKGKDVDKEFPGGERKCSSDMDTDHQYLENFIRAYASHPLWKGDINFGVAMDDYIQTTFSNDLMLDDDIIHARAYCFVPMAFALLEQTFGKVKLDAGLLYQAAAYSYKPFDDDQTVKTIVEKTGKRDLYWNRHSLQPHLTVSTDFNDVKLSAGLYSNTSLPTLLDVYVNTAKLDGKDVSKAFAQVEEQYSAFLKGSWKWIDFKTWGTRYHLPIFQDIEGVFDYNGPDYWAMDCRLTLSPTVAFWSTSLTATMHKQWLAMPVADPVDNLPSPLWTLQWNNGLEFPWGMRFDLNALLRSKGADRNTFYRDPSWKMDVSLQQPFFDKHLSVGFGVDNLFFKYCDNIAFYKMASASELDFNDRLLGRIFRITLRYTL